MNKSERVKSVKIMQELSLNSIRTKKTLI